MDKAKLTITGGNVHEIGYRLSLLTSALNFGITSVYTYNESVKGKQAVIILIGGVEEEIIHDFYNNIKADVPDDIEVSDFELEEFQGSIPDINISLRLIQMEMLSKAIPAIIDTSENTKAMLDIQDSMLEKYDLMMEKTGEIIRLLRNTKKDT